MSALQYTMDQPALLLLNQTSLCVLCCDLHLRTPPCPSMLDLQVLIDERLAENAKRMGGLLRRELTNIAQRSDGLVASVRGKGLLNAIVIYVSKEGQGDRCHLMLLSCSLCNANVVLLTAQALLHACMCCNENM